MCGDGLTCFGGVCTEFHGAGDPCGEDGDCESNLLCLAGFEGPETGSCRLGGVDRECCSPDVTDCSGGCRFGLSCDLGGHCRLPGCVGDACDVATDYDHLTCLAGLRCSEEGTCQRPGLPGASCSEDTDCDFDLRCSEGECAVFGGVCLDY